VPIEFLDIVIRLSTALACGTVIGLNRDFHGKPAGFRTFGLVGLGSGLVVLTMEQFDESGADAVSRVIQGVLTGIGFLGAGVIFHRHQPSKVQGLTTAASVWLTAGLGMAAGAGQLMLTWTALVLGMLVLMFGRHCEKLFELIFGKPRHKKQREKDREKPEPEEPPSAGESQQARDRRD
jgi:putative Mg2+ transporter-C (MgtC) family protein